MSRKLPGLRGVTRLRWMAAGDLLPDRTPDWMLDHLWPSVLMQRVICRLWGHEVEHPVYDPTSCAWCDAVLPASGDTT